MKKIFILLGLIGLMLIGCAVHSALPWYNTSQWDAFYTGGDGSSTEQAIVINTTDDDKTIDAENHYLSSTITNMGNTYILRGRSTYNISGRIYDKLEIVVNQSTLKEVHFDVTMPRSQAIRNN